MSKSRIATTLLVLAVVVGTTVPAMAFSTGANQSPAERAAMGPAPAAANVTAGNGTVNVTVGQQLSTVIGVSGEEIETEFENTAFEVSIEHEAESDQAEAIADRAEELRKRAEKLGEDYEEATEDYEDGEIDKSTFAQRLATLNARTTNLISSHDQLQERAENVSALELRAAGLTESTLEATVENLSSLNGSGTTALLDQFTGAASGEIEIETDGGVSIEIEREDGSVSREYERHRDDNHSLSVNQSDALETARSALSSPENGTWVLQESSIDSDDGAYEFEFALRNASGSTGEAEVAVDGSSGEVFEFEFEVEAEDDDEHEDDEHEDDDQEGELAVVVSDGTPAPNATVTLQVLADGEPAENVSLLLNDRSIGPTDANGTVTVTLPEAGEVEVEAEDGDREGELEFEFGESEDDEVYRTLAVESSVDDGNVTTEVTYDGSTVSNATVYANDRMVGTTDGDGTVTFALDDNTTEELEVEVVKGDFEAELEYVIQDGSLVLTEGPHEGDGDKSDEYEGDDDAEEDDDEESADDSDDDEQDDSDDDGEDDSDDTAEETDDGIDDDDGEVDDGSDDTSDDSDSEDDDEEDGEEDDE